ncbi:MAG: hypothetical protein LUF25_04515 [Phascolarctobacterium sp.]|nr:hypothetical protein [Phascolarctobacterium sp.]
MKFLIFLIALFLALPAGAATPPGMKRVPRISVEPNQQHAEYFKNRENGDARKTPAAPAPVYAHGRHVTRQYMRTPYAADFEYVRNPAYTVLMPKSFGGDLLNGAITGPMMVRGSSDNLFIAVNIEGNGDYGFSREPLPDFKGGKTYWTWTHSSAITWNCSLRSYSDYAGRKIILEARTTSGEKTIDIIFAFPANEMYRYLPQALYSINSFRLVR